MLIIDDKWMTKGMLEDIGRTQGIDNEGLTYDEYLAKVQKELKAPDVIAPRGRDIAGLSANGLRVYLYSTTGLPMDARAYAEWLGKEYNRGVLKAFTEGMANAKEQGVMQ